MFNNSTHFHFRTDTLLSVEIHHALPCSGPKKWMLDFWRHRKPGCLFRKTTKPETLSDMRMRHTCLHGVWWLPQYGYFRNSQRTGTLGISLWCMGQDGLVPQASIFCNKWELFVIIAFFCDCPNWIVLWSRGITFQPGSSNVWPIIPVIKVIKLRLTMC